MVSLILRHKKDLPMQSLKWTAKLEKQDLDTVTSRDYQYLSLSAFYTRDLSDLIDKFDLSWVTYGSLRIKDWDSPVANSREDEEEYFIQTGIRSDWNNQFSSSLNVSFEKGIKASIAREEATLINGEWSQSNTFLSL